MEALGDEENTQCTTKDAENHQRGPDDARPQRMLRNMAGLRAQITRVTGNADLALDLLQDAIVTALQKLRDGEISDSAQLDGYVYRVALNHYRNYQRKDRSAITDITADVVIDPDAASRPVEAIEAAQWARLVRELLKEITPIRDRELLVRFYLYEQSKDELCRHFGLSELHFNRVIFRARDRFRELLQRRGFARSDFLSIATILSAVF